MMNEMMSRTTTVTEAPDKPAFPSKELEEHPKPEVTNEQAIDQPKPLNGNIAKPEVTAKSEITAKSQNTTAAKPPDNIVTIEDTTSTTSKTVAVAVTAEAVNKPPKDKSHRCLGIFFALCATLCLSVSTFIVKLLLKKGYSIYLSIFWRFIGVVVPSIPMLFVYRYYVKKPVFDSIWPLKGPDRVAHRKNLAFIILRSMVGSGGFIFQYSALKFISIGDTSVITYSSPIFVLGFSCCCLHEKCGWYPTFVTFLTVIGVVLIAHPSFMFPTLDEEKTNETQKLFGVLLAIGAMTSTAVTIVLLRCLKDVHFTVISIIFGAMGVIVGLILSLAILDESGSHSFKLPRKAFHTFLFISLALLSFFGQLFLTLALQFEEAGTVSVIRTMDSVVSFGLEGFTGIVPSPYSIGGGIIVILSVCMIAFRKYLMNTKEENPDHPCVKKLWFVLK